jgi:hypothetical protein
MPPTRGESVQPRTGAWPTIELRFTARRSAGEVSALLTKPDVPRAVLAFAHGAGAGMRHVFMETMAARLAGDGIATLRYQFPYMEKRTGRPDPQPILLSAVRAAVAAAAGAVPGVPILAGGKSMGGRMTSNAQADTPLEGVRGLVFFGFPLHPAGRPGVERAAHLERVAIPMLFLQGTRDTLAELDLLRPVVEKLGTRARLCVIEGADHSFAVLKRSGRTHDQVLDELARVTGEWLEGVI